jgi:hypothetical protein
MRLRYRVIQFLRALQDRPSASELAFVRAHLPSELLSLFERMSPSDQAHSIRVCQSLLENGHSDAELLAAALLHDVGKSLVRPNILERVLVVLANRIAPKQVLKWSEGQAIGWRRAFVIAHKHPQWGADLVAERGGPEVTVYLIRHHQRSSTEPLNDSLSHRLSLLQAADSDN